MDRNKIVQILKNVFSSVGFIYLVGFVLVISLVDVKAVASRFNTRRVNDARPAMEPLVSFSAGRIAPEAVDWQPYRTYFGLVLKYMPSEPVSQMFLGVCEYYAGHDKEKVWVRLQASADRHPFVFWNMYDAGILAFERKDMALAMQYFERALFLPPQKIVMAIRSSVVYRQVMAASNFDLDMAERIKEGRERAYLFLAASSFYAKDTAKARSVAVSALGQDELKDKEPFFFYAGAASLALGNVKEAFAFLRECAELRSQNFLVYKYLSEMLEGIGQREQAQDMRKLSDQLHKEGASDFPYAERLKPRFF